MNNPYEQSLHFNDSAFDGMRNDADIVLQKLIKNMVEKDSLEGKVTITIDVSLEQEFIPNHDPRIEGETRRVLTPKLSHKVGSMMQIKSETKGDKHYDGMELVYDEEKGEYVLKPIANTDQMTIFDAEFTECEVEEETYDETEAPVLEGRRVAGLIGTSDEEEEHDAEITEEEIVTDENDMSDEFITEANDGFDEYEYEEPEEETE